MPNIAKQVIESVVARTLLALAGGADRYGHQVNALGKVIDGYSKQELRVAYEVLADLTWDLADSWGRRDETFADVLDVLQNGRARGWSVGEDEPDLTRLPDCSARRADVAE